MPQPRFETARTPSRPTFGGRIAKVALRAGYELMPWQRLVADVGAELVQDPDTGLWVPAFREVVFTVARQNGKTSLVLPWELDRALMWRLDVDTHSLGMAQRIAYTAQTGQDARDKMVEDQYPIIETRFAKALQGKPTRSAANTAVRFKNGSRLVAQATAEESGHGKTNDLVVLDELFADEDDRRQQSAIPSMVTKPDAQILAMSTAGTEKSVVWNRKVELGRAAVEAGRTSGIAYFEWSSDPKADPDDPKSWQAASPAWGYTISEAAVQHARDTLVDDEFRRAFMNVPRGKGQERIVPEGLWRTVCKPDAAPQNPITLAVDAHPDHVQGWVVAADAAGNAELLPTPPETSGVGWLADWLAARAVAHGNAPVALDLMGPVGFLAEELKARHVSVIEYRTAQLRDACGWWWQALGDGKMNVRSSPILDEAVDVVTRRFYGDQWLWVRGRDPDTSPVVALTIGLHAAATRPTADPLANIW